MQPKSSHMRNGILYIVTIALCLAGCQTARHSTATINAGTFNLRCENKGDSLNGNGWGRRCPVMASLIKFHDFEIFGTQEASKRGLEQMRSMLPGFDYIGVGRDDGKTKGEHAAIFYRTDLFELRDSGNFWLSETPEVPSVGWDAALPRICTWGRFKVKATGQEFCYFNLHMDHVGVQARMESAKLVVRKVRETSHGLPVILTGDFNVDQTNSIYSEIVGSEELQDSYETCELRYAWDGTPNNFNPSSFTSSRLDHVFVSPETRVIRYGVLTDTYRTMTEEAAKYKDGNFPREVSFQAYEARTPSDHFPVKAVIELNGKKEKPAIGKKTLDPDGWAPSVYAGLTEMIARVGNTSPDYDPSCKPYAVFDFDNTTIIGDIEHALFNYKIEKLKYRTVPDEMFSLLTSSLPSADFLLDMGGGRKVPVRALVNDIVSDYRFLFGKPLEEVEGTLEYLDFRAKLKAMYYALVRTISYENTALWLKRLQTEGMTVEEFKALVRESTAYSFTKGGNAPKTWTSPVMGEAGYVTVTTEYGLGISKNMKDLYAKLEANGIVPYICTASIEENVTAVACDGSLGIKVPEERIFGVKLLKDAAGRFTDEYDPEWVLTAGAGKTETILKRIAPLHGGKGPVLVGGDSNGDYEMLTDFPDMQCGLIINLDRTDPIRSLYNLQPRYLLQGRDAAHSRFVPNSESRDRKMVMARFVPEREDDFIFENNLSCGRIYGKALENSIISPGVDIWVKTPGGLVADGRYAGTHEGRSFHKDWGNGKDCYQVGISLGGGASAPMVGGNLAFPATNYRSYEVLEDNPEKVVFVLHYPEWEVCGGKIALDKKVTVEPNTYFFKAEDTYTFSGFPGDTLSIAAGISLHKDLGTVAADHSDSRSCAIWEKASDQAQEKEDGMIGVAVVMPDAGWVGTTADGSHLVCTRTIRSGETVTYWFGNCWSKGSIKTPAKWFHLTANLLPE